MKSIRKHLQKLTLIEKAKHHPLIHHLHKKYHISKKTLFYIKEYGPKSNVPKVIIKESVKILIFASIISLFTGSLLEHSKTFFAKILPLLILLPALNDMIGDYSIIISSRFSTMLHEGKIKNKIFHNKELKTLFVQILIISATTALLSSLISAIISGFSGYKINLQLTTKIVAISILDSLILIAILFLVAVFAGLYFFKKQEDPNNFLIPITTAIADFGNVIILSILASLIL